MRLTLVCKGVGAMAEMRHSSIVGAYVIAVMVCLAPGVRGNTLWAQDAPAAQTGTVSPSQPIAPTLPLLDSVRVVGVARADRPVTKKNSAVAAGLGDIISIRVRNLNTLINYVKCLSIDGRAIPNCEEREIGLYLDGREMRGMTPESIDPSGDADALQFHLQRSNDSDEAWADLLGAPRITRRDDFFERPTKLSVGPAGGRAVHTDVTPKEFHLIRLRLGWFVGCSLLLIPLLFLFWRAAIESNLLRDPVPETGETKENPAPYSLARTQMAFWFILIVTAFVYIWLVTGGWESVTTSVLGLMGIGAGTALGSAVIDGNKPDSKRKAQRFIRDLLTDTNGYSFHRVQMFVWTIVLGILFVYSVWNRLAMPTFSGTLLALLGISGGTYLGFKIPEQPGPSPPPPKKHKSSKASGSSKSSESDKSPKSD